MSVKIRVSYETEAEFDQIQTLLAPLGLRVNIPVPKGERFMRAYLFDRRSTPYYGERKTNGRRKEYGNL